MSMGSSIRGYGTGRIACAVLVGMFAFRAVANEPADGCKVDPMTTASARLEAGSETTSVPLRRENVVMRQLDGEASLAARLKRCDVLLSQSVMDGETLNILSDWKLGQHSRHAIANLLRNGRKADGCEFVRAACWMQVGDLYRAADALNAAEFYYHSILTQCGPAAAAYHDLAAKRLDLIL